MNLLSREDALNKNSVFYFTGIECKNKHIDKRYTNTGICYACKRNRSNRNYKRNTDTVKKRARRAYEKNKEEIKRKAQLWCEKNRAKSNSYKKRNKLKNRKAYLKQAREYASKKRKDPYYRICKAISKQLWSFLKGNKCKNSWRSFVDYTDTELIDHLKSKFTKEMNMENYGTYWSIDHIKPVSWFLKEIEEKKLTNDEILLVVKEIWSLNNLQPLECSKNSSKCNRYIG